MIWRFFILSFLTVCVSVHNIRSQAIELKEVWIDCDTIIQGDSTLFGLRDFTFIFYAINRHQNSLCIGANCPSGKKNEAKYGYFEVKIDTLHFTLKSRDSEPITIPNNDSIEIRAEYRKEANIEQSYSDSDLYDIIVSIEDSCYDNEDLTYNMDDHMRSMPTIKIANLANANLANHFETPPKPFAHIIRSKIFYSSIKDDYKGTNCELMFPNQEIIKNNFSIILECGGEGLYYYPVEKSNIDRLFCPTIYQLDKENPSN